MDVSKQQDLAPEKMGKVDDWTREELLKVPQQRNGTDCGIFALLFARFAVNRRSPNFEQIHIPYYRRQMCYHILNKEVQMVSSFFFTSFLSSVKIFILVKIFYYKYSPDKIYSFYDFSQVNSPMAAGSTGSSASSSQNSSPSTSDTLAASMHPSVMAKSMTGSHMSMGAEVEFNTFLDRLGN
jgi:hypothetical protein